MTDNRRPSNPAEHEAHGLPLADRIVDDLIRDYLDTAYGLAQAGFGDLNEYDRGAQAGIEQLRHLHLDGYSYTLTPKILAALTAAGWRPTVGDNTQAPDSDLVDYLEQVIYARLTMGEGVRGAARSVASIFAADPLTDCTRWRAFWRRLRNRRTP